MDNEAIALRKQMDETLAALSGKIGELEQQVTGTVRTVQDSVNTVRETFDIKLHVRRRPWTLLAGAAALGLLGGLRFNGRRAASQPRDAGRDDANGVRATRIPRAAAPSWLATLGDTFRPEIADLKGIAIGAAFGLARDLLAKQVSKPTSRPVEDPDTNHTGKPESYPAPTRRTREW